MAIRSSTGTTLLLMTTIVATNVCQVFTVQ
jgi:hypothetical protein